MEKRDKDSAIAGTTYSAKKGAKTRVPKPQDISGKDGAFVNLLSSPFPDAGQNLLIHGRQNLFVDGTAILETTNIRNILQVSRSTLFSVDF